MKNEIRLRWLVIGSFISSLGTSFIWPLTTIYLHNQLHESLTIIGFVLLIYSGTNVIGSYLSGMLFDSADPRKLIIMGLIIDILAMSSLIFWNGWPVYPILLAVVGFFNGWLTTLINSLGTLIRSIDGRHVFNMLYFANNLGIVLGTSVVGFIYRGNVSPLFALTAILYVAYLFVAVKHFRIVRPAKGLRQKDEVEKIPIPKPNLIVMWTFFISLAIVWIMYEQWVSNMSVYVTDSGVSLAQYSFLWTINAGLIVIIQVIMSRITRFLKNPYNQIYIGILFCAISFFVLIFAHSYAAFVLAMVILTVGEVTAFPTMPAVVNMLSPQDVKGKYQGLMNAFSSIGKALGPLFGGLIIEGSSYKILFIVCAGAIIAVDICIMVIAAWKKKHLTSY